jgi:predicted transcriptional regulator
MQSHYRDKFDIITSILDIANGDEVKQVKILVKANIPHNVFKEFLFLLHQNGLIEYTQSQRTYRTTTKGLHFLSIVNEMKTIANIDGMSFLISSED